MLISAAIQIVINLRRVRLDYVARLFGVSMFGINVFVTPQAQDSYCVLLLLLVAAVVVNKSLNNN